MKSTKSPSQNKMLPWQGICWPLGQTLPEHRHTVPGVTKRWWKWDIEAACLSWTPAMLIQLYYLFWFMFFLTLPCFLGWAVSPLSVVLIHEFPHPSGAQFCMWNGHLPNKRPGSFTGSLQTICRLHSRTTSPLQRATRTFSLAHVWLWKFLSAKGYKMLCTSSCRRNSPSEQELLHYL